MVQYKCLVLLSLFLLLLQRQLLLLLLLQKQQLLLLLNYKSATSTITTINTFTPTITITADFISATIDSITCPTTTLQIDTFLLYNNTTATHNTKISNYKKKPSHAHVLTLTRTHTLAQTHFFKFCHRMFKVFFCLFRNDLSLSYSCECTVRYTLMQHSYDMKESRAKVETINQLMQN